MNGGIERCHAYIIGADRAGPLKVGVAGRPLTRLSGLQTGHPLRLQCFWVEASPHGTIIERLTHQILAPRRLMGEWFDIPVEVAISAITYATIIHDERVITDAGEELLCEWRWDIGYQCSYRPFLRPLAESAAVPLLDEEPKFNRNAYQREYMRKRRAAKVSNA